MTAPILPILEEYKELFDVARRVDQQTLAMLEEFNAKQLKLFNLPAHQRIFLFIFTRSLKTYASVLSLCERGYGQDVATLLRSLLENLITAKYILHNPRKADGLAKRFVAYKWVIFKRHLPEQEKEFLHATSEEKTVFEHKKNAIMKNVAEFKRNFNVTSDRALVTWSGKTVRDMAKEINQDLVDEYDTTFRLCSRFSHPSILGDKEYLIQDGTNLIFSPLPSGIGIVPNLSKAIKYTLEFLATINSLFLSPENHVLQELADDLQKILTMGKYHAKSVSSPTTSESQPQSIRDCIINFQTENK